MHQKARSKSNRSPSKRSFKKVLATSGLSEKVSKKVWEWYNPPEKSNNPYS
jgi:hypothetical protein